MSFTLIQTGEASALFSDRAIIKAGERRAVEDAAALLAEATRVAAQAREAARTALAEARADGMAEGIAAVRGEVASALAAMARDVAAAERRREEEIAGAAMAALEAIVGAAGVERIGPALVRQTLAAFEAQDVTVEVGPDLADALHAELADAPGVTLVANPVLGPLDCQLRIAQGTVRAGLQVQLAALATRWGLADTGGTEASA